MEVAEEMQIRESRGSRRVAPGGRNKKPNIKVLALLLLAVCRTARVAGGAYLSRRRAAPVSQQGLTYEANAVSGNIPGKTREQRQRELDSVVEEGILTMPTNVTPFGKTTGADRPINWTIGNPSNQRKLIRTEIIRDDTREKMSETGAIRPGSYLESGPLLTPPPAGGYDYTTVSLAYQEKTETLVERAVVKTKLVS